MSGENRTAWAVPGMHNGFMPYTEIYTPEILDRATLNQRNVPLVLEFGTNWCGHCQAAQPAIRAALSEAEGLEHIKIEDGPGRPLGRSFGVKLWPTLVFWHQGQELARLVRPTDVETVKQGLQALEDSGT